MATSHHPARRALTNNAHPGDKFRGVTWLNHKLPDDLEKLYGNNTESPLEASPYGNELVEMLAERALSAEQLGKRDSTDILAVSFSSNDKVGHNYGTYSPEEHDVTIETDKILERLFAAIDKQVGLDNTIIVLTGDHGVAPSAAEDAANRMPGGRMPGNTVRNAVQAALVASYGEGEWVSGSWDLSLYLDEEHMARMHLDPAEVRRVAAVAAMRVAHISRVYTRDQLQNGAVSGDQVSRRMMNGFNQRRSPDIQFIPEPYWIIANAVANATGLTVAGAGLAGDAEQIAVNDIAPTLATILEVEIPSGSVGRVLNEIW